MEDLSESDSDTDVISTLAVAAVLISRKSTRRRRKKKCWVNSYLQDRKDKGRFFKDFEDMQRNPRIFFENFHMSPDRFQQLLCLIEPCIRFRKNTRPDDMISPQEKLSMTLEFLASGSQQRHVASIYRVSKQRLGVIIDEVCEAICNQLKPVLLQRPTEERWINISNEFNEKWNIPNCLGSVDGKHIAIKCPKNAESSFFNYKKHHSIILMAVADADSKFVYFDVGAYGSEADGQVFRSCELGKDLASGNLQLPHDSTVFGKKLPYFFVADDAFPLQRNILKPYKPAQRSIHLSEEERIFNYRLSRARRTVENCFGILCARWICFGRTLFVNPVKAQKIVAACCVLHNYCMSRDKQNYSPTGFSDFYDNDGNFVEGYWRNMIPENSMMNNSLPAQNGGRTPVNAKEVRDHIKNYVNSDIGSLEWQRSAVHL